jgi:hypothetical protein
MHGRARYGGPGRALARDEKRLAGDIPKDITGQPLPEIEKSVPPLRR